MLAGECVILFDELTEKKEGFVKTIISETSMQLKITPIAVTINPLKSGDSLVALLLGFL